MRGQGSGPKRRTDTTERGVGVPIPQQDPNTPEGWIEQAGRFGSGLKNLTGRRAIRYCLAALYVSVAVAVLFLLIAVIANLAAR